VNGKQSITLSIPKDILQQAKVLAVKRNLSLSGLITDMLIELVENEVRYEEAMRRNLSRFEEARALSGDYSWSRESLHER
jgi:hypothetical protein